MLLVLEAFWPLKLCILCRVWDLDIYPSIWDSLLRRFTTAWVTLNSLSSDVGTFRSENHRLCVWPRHSGTFCRPKSFSCYFPPCTLCFKAFLSTTHFSPYTHLGSSFKGGENEEEKKARALTPVWHFLSTCRRVREVSFHFLISSCWLILWDGHQDGTNDKGGHFPGMWNRFSDETEQT